MPIYLMVGNDAQGGWCIASPKRQAASRRLCFQHPLVEKGAELQAVLAGCP